MAQQNTNNEGYDVKKSFSNNIQLVGFRLGEEIYATDVMKIEEIIRFTDITTVPRTDSFVLGVMNLRGKVIPVIDLRIRFDLNKFDFDKDTSIIVVNFNTEYLGFVVDSVIEVMRISQNMINPNPPLVGTVGQEYILGICRYNDQMVFILDIDRVVFEGKKYTDSALKKLIQGKEESEKTNEKEIIKVIDKTQVNHIKVTEKDVPVENNKKEKVPSEQESEKVKVDIDKLIEEELKKKDKSSKEDSLKKIDEKEKQHIKPLKTFNVDGKVFSEKEIDELIELELKKKVTESTELKKEKTKIETASNVEPETEPVENISELKKITQKIIDSDYIDIDTDINNHIKGEAAQLLKELRNVKEKYNILTTNLISSKKMLPKIANDLKDVNEITEKSTNLLFNVLDPLNYFFEDLLIEVENIKKYTDEDNFEQSSVVLDTLQNKIKEYVDVAFKIYEVLEFEDINDQKINRTLKLLSDIGARFAAILGYIKDKKIKDISLTQDEIDNLLKNYGF